MPIKIHKRSNVEFQFGDAEPVVSFDVIEVTDQWHEINFALRVLENDMWTLPPNKTNEFAVNRLNFVQGLVNEAYAKQHKDKPVPTLTRIEAEEFVRHSIAEADALRNFTSPKSEEISSAPESTEAGTNFSQ